MISMTEAAMNSDQVYALVVGIETYELGADYNLPGPAQDGLNFINWLLSQGVLPGHIRFFVSPLAENVDVRSQAEKRDIKTSPATRDAIDGYIRNELITEQAKGEGLYVFWGGHGILTKTHSADRRLLFADTTAVNKLNLDVNSLVQALSTSAHGAGFNRQIFLVDACANSYFQGLYETLQGEAAGHGYSATGEQVKAEQSVLFAAAEYEVAKNSLGTGLFSAAVLAELQGQPLWPDMKALVERVQADFKKENKPEPDYLWLKRGGWQEVIDNFRYEKVASQPKKAGLGVQMKVERLNLQIQQKREQYEREKALLGGVSGGAEYQIEQNLARLEADIARLETARQEVSDE
jgi:Caspase domain